MTLHLEGLVLAPTGPWPATHIDMTDRGLISLYGVNGAGKSSLLSAVANALRDERGLTEWSVEDGGSNQAWWDVELGLIADVVENGGLGGEDPMARHFQAVQHLYQDEPEELDWLEAVQAKGAGWLLAVIFRHTASMPPDSLVELAADVEKSARVISVEGDLWVALPRGATTYPLVEDPTEITARDRWESSGDVEWAELLATRSAVPLFPLGVHLPTSEHVLLIEPDTPGDLDELATRIIERGPNQGKPFEHGDFRGQSFHVTYRPVLGVDEAGRRRTPVAAQAAMAALDQTVNELLQAFCPGTPALATDPTDPLTEPAGPRLRWRCLSADGEDLGDINALSSAQRRWATVAIGLASRQHDQSGTYLSAGPDAFAPHRYDDPKETIVLMDEPERALHRAGERRLAARLREWSAEQGWTMIAATHSPEILRGADHRWHVRRDGEGQAEVTTLGGIVGETSPDALGLHTRDIFGLVGAFLLVEGAHDEAVLEELLGDELANRDVRMLKLHGARKLHSTLASQLLLQMTDAPLICLLDGVDGSRVQKTYAEVWSAWDDDRGTARKALEAMRGPTEESQIIADLMKMSFEAGVGHRFIPIGLKKRDIIEYLPCDRFVDGATWPELVREWKSNRGGMAFKAWLKSEKRARVSVASIRAAAKSMDSVPKEFTTLLDLLDRLPHPPAGPSAKEER